MDRLEHPMHAERGPEETVSDDAAALLAELLAADTMPLGAPLARRSHAGPLPLSFAQQRLWFLWQLDPTSAFYSAPRTFKLSGALDVDALSNSLDAIVARHEILRTTFPFVAGQPRQVVGPAEHVPLPYVDLRALDRAARSDEAARLTREDVACPFDLARGPLLRARLLRIDDDVHLLYLNMHHIVVDGWSMGVLFRELGALYDAFTAGRPANLPELPVQYGDFAVWQRAAFRGERLERELQYWTSQLTGAATWHLAGDRARPEVQTFRGSHRTRHLPRTLYDALQQLGQREGATLFMTLLAAWSVLLHRRSRQTDIVIGSGIANRNRSELEALIGFFVNTLALRIDLSGNPSFRALLARVREMTLAAYAHQDLPFELLVEELRPERRTDQNPLFQVSFVLQNAPGQRRELRGLTVEAIEGDTGTAKFDLSLFMREGSDGIAAYLEYNSDLFDAATVDDMLAELETLLAAIVANPETRISRLAILPDPERRLLAGWNQTAAAVPGGCMHEWFEAHAQRAPDAIAVECRGRAVSYGELNARANQLAHHLRAIGVGPEQLVAVYSKRSLEFVLGTLAILKAGGAYVPLDPSYPRDRLVFVLQDCGARVLLTEQELAPLLPCDDLAVVKLDALPDLGMLPTGNVELAVDPDNLAYVIYTSGSTGRPKGVAVPHRGVVNLCASFQQLWQVRADARAAHLASTAFDASVWETWPFLTAGATVVIGGAELVSDCDALQAWIVDQNITHCCLATAIAEQMIDRPWPRRALRYLSTGGDELRHAPRQDLPFHLINAYGPTEATVAVTASFVAPHGELAPAIGRPLPNLAAYVLDDELQPVPIGAPGELCIWGAGVTRGYLHRPELTAERFVPDPSGAGRIYRTGDLARFRRDGELEFLGRIDRQIKLRGFRIELGEIEAALRQHAGVADALVVVRNGPAGESQLAAYVVPVAGRSDHGIADLQIARWEQIFDENYAQSSSVLAGWNSSYTGLPIPAAEMQEWVDRTIERIRALGPRRVLEIGCGTGLLLSVLAPGCEHYVATDFSREVIDRLAMEQRDLPQVALSHRRADDFTGFEDGAFDTVILNSVVQYFPDAAYLRRVIAGAVRVTRSGGAVFVGDVRHLQMLGDLCRSIELAHSRDELALSELQARVDARLARETELVVDPALFDQLRSDLPRIVDVELRPKRGHARNELTRFRYDVVLRIGEQTIAKTAPAVTRDGSEQRLTIAAVRELLAEHPPQLVVRRVPVARLCDVRWLAELLAGQALVTVGELRRALAERSTGGAVDPEAWFALGDELSYAVDIRLSHAARWGELDVLFTRPEATANPVQWPDEVARSTAGSLASLANEPLRAVLGRDLLLSLRDHLRQRLPDYMIPPDYVLLDALPLQPSGKLDRNALPAPDAVRVAVRTYLPPTTALQQRVAGIWRELLGVERVGLNDNFFDLGGHSLLLAQLHDRLRAVGAERVALIDLFRFPTVRAQVELIERIACPAGEPAGQPATRRTRRGRAAEGPADIAVIGMAVRFPGAASVEQFWQNLRDGVEAIRRFSNEELLAAGVDPRLLADPRFVPARGIVDDVERFDAEFFGFTAREAELCDPQQRLFLECVWEGLERAAQDPDRSGPVGVFAGGAVNTYFLRNLYPNQALIAASGSLQIEVGNDIDFLATRASYRLNLKGPAVTVQTACSTSLVAAHMACRALAAGDCDVAVAGGATVHVPVKSGYLYQEGAIRSPDGHCRAFDARAQGTIGGDGVGVVVLKRLSDALADGDPIHAVIKGTAINNDGGEKIGFTAPSAEGQSRVIGDALAAGEVAPETISYVETHGTGTVLGDPIEIAALSQAFGPAPARQSCAIGSVKTAIGHLGAAAGVAGLIKTVLALEHAELPPSLHFTVPNPHIDFAATPFYVNTRTVPWQTAALPRRAGVSSFGIGGTNAHAVLEEAPRRPRADATGGWQLLPLSARTTAALEARAADLARYLEAHADHLEDVAFTLQMGRRMFEYRRVVLCRDRAEAIAALRTADDLSWAGSSEPPPGGADDRRVLGELAQRWLTGEHVDFRPLHPEGRCKLVLPSYRFERKRYWIDPPDAPAAVAPAPRDATRPEPGSEVAETLATVWHEILGGDAVRPGDDFFQRGGDSLAVLQLAARLGETFLLDVPVDRLFEATTFRAQVNEIEALLEHRQLDAAGGSGQPHRGGL